MIDTKNLPRRVAADTGFLIRALGDRPGDSRSQPARDLLQAIVDSGGTIIVPAPALAELIRGNPSGPWPLPRNPSFFVGSFDEKCARILGERFPPGIIKQQVHSSGFSKGYVQFDTMILATALRYKAECLITMDHTFRLLDYGDAVAKGFRKQIKDFELPLFQQASSEDPTGL